MCCNEILTTAVAVTDDTLILTIPDGTYINCQAYTLRLAQSIPTTATALMPVVVQIGTETTQYPLVKRCGHYVYADQLRARRRYRVVVAADTARFVVVSDNLCGRNGGTVASLPIATTATTGGKAK